MRKGLKEMVSILVILVFQTCISAFAQDAFNSKRSISEFDIKRVLSSNEEHRYKNIIPEEFLVPTLIALSYYPELDSIEIDFRKRNIQFTMVSRPKINFLFKNKNDREYVLIYNTTRNNKGVLPNNLPLDAQIGLLGHELSHIVDYKDKKNREIVGYTFKYMFNKSFKRNLEYKTDSVTVEHGLGWQLYDLSDYFLYKSDKPKEYKKYKQTNYMTPDEIEEMLLNYKKR